MFKQQITLLLLLLVTVDADTDNKPIPFSVGSRYEYSYSAEIVMKEVDKFYFSATAFLSGYRESQCEEKEGVAMREGIFGELNCTSVHVRLADTRLVSVQAKQQGHEAIEHTLNFSQWFSFYQRQDGLISKVRYPEDEDRQVLQLKKAVTSAFSLRLHNYIRNKGTKVYGGWTYRVPDLDHSGAHSASYEVQESNKMVTYRKVKKDRDNKHVHNKEIQIVKETGHIELVKVEDTAELSHSYNTETYSIENPPPIKATSVSHIDLKTKSNFDSLSIQEPVGLILDSIIAQRVEKGPIVYRTALREIHSNLSHTDNCYPTATTECVKTLKKIVDVVELMKEQDVIKLSTDYLTCPFNKKQSHVLSMIDVFGMCDRATCQSVLVSFLNASCVEIEMAFTIVQHASVSNLPSLFTIDTIDKLAFHHKSFPKQLQNLTLSDMAVLALGSMSATLRDIDPLLADRILSKLHRMTLPHDHERYKRENTVKQRKRFNQSVGLMRQSSLINSIGNAGHENSFNLLKSYIESEHAPSLLRRSAIGSLNSYHTDEAADTILSAALIDEEEVVRYEATLQYRHHPRADSMSDVLSEFYNYTNAVQSPADASRRRVRRFSIFDAIMLVVQTPRFTWKKTIGSSEFGASMGIIIRNMMELNIQPLNGRFEVNIHDEAYFVANLGFVGVNFDVFRARVCFKGYIEYNLNILQELGINSFSDLANIYDETIGAVVSSIKQAITDFRNALDADIDVRYMFDTLVQAVSELPFLIQDLVVAPALRSVLEQLKQLPFVQSGMSLIDEVKSLFDDVRSDLLMFYQEISDCVTVTLPWVGQTIKTAIEAIGDSIVNFFSNPIISIRDVIVGVAQLKSAFDAVIDCKDILVNAAKFEGAHVRGWMDLVDRLKGIYNSTIETKDLILEQARAFSEIRNVSTFESATGINVTMLRLKAYSDLKVAFEAFTKPLAPLLDIVQPFVTAYNSAVNLITTAINAYETLRATYNDVKNLIERLFGPKFHRSFPRQIRGSDGCEASRCGCGYYPTTSGDPRVYKDGLQIEISSGSKLVAPTSGLYMRVPDNQVIIYPTGSFRRYVILIHNVNLLSNVTTGGVTVEGGDQIGTVTANPFGCDSNFIHFTVMTRSRGSPTDANPFLQPRFLQTPEWIEECNDYALILLGKVNRQGRIVGRPDRRNSKGRGACTGGDMCTSPNLPVNNIRPPDTSSYKDKYSSALGDARSSLLPSATSNGPRGPTDRPVGEDLSNFFTEDQTEKYKEDSSGFSLTVSNDDGEFNFSVNTIKVGFLLDILKSLTSGSVREIITTVENTIEYIREALDCTNEELVDPSLLDIGSIQNSLKIRGLPFQGNKEKLIADLIALPADLCPSIQKAIPANRWCSISQDCLTLRCAAALRLDFFTYSVSFSVTFDPCVPSITLKFQEMEKVIELPDIYGGSEITLSEESIDLLGLATVELGLKLTRMDTNIFFDFTAYLCAPDETSEDYSHCFYTLQLLAGAGFQIPSPLNCNSNKVTRQASETSDVTSCGVQIPDFLNMTLGEFVTYIKDLGDSGSSNNATDNLNQMMQDLRNVFLTEMLNAIFSGKSPISGGDTDFPTTFDVCVSGSFGLQRTINFYRVENYLFIGFVPIHFTFSLDGLYGIQVGARLCFITMVVNGNAEPNVALLVSGSAAISFGIADAGIRVTGVICDTRLPVQPTIGFKTFPLAIRLRVDLQIIPLSISVSVFLRIKINLLFTSFTKTLINKEIFSWSSPSITINLFDVSNFNPDNSPPLFSPISESGSRRRRAASGATPCTLTQVAGRDYTDPAFILQVSVADDKSQAELTYSVGTYPGGDDEVSNDRMNGNTVLIARVLTPGIPLYWTASASNSQGVSVSTQCSLPTYDMTPPVGRVDFNGYIYSSHPSKLIGETTIIDDTNLQSQVHAVGYGRAQYGDQTVPFTTFVFDQYSLQTTNNVFIKIPNKRLGVTPFKTSSGSLAECEADCLLFPLKCFSFNYALVLGICQLLNDIGADASIQFNSDLQYSYYERTGIGNHASFQYVDLPLIHDTLYHLNLYIVNDLLYESYFYSPAMLIDFTVPEPGTVNNASMNITRHDGCSAAFNQRCDPIEYVTTIEYHRIIQDGPESDCIYNGPILLTDLMYTRLNSFVSITYHGFHDDQSGIYAYAWFMGFQTCAQSVVGPRDPNAASTSELSNINQGRILQHFDDGIYYVTVQALNQVIFGGSGVLSLCHSTEYVIDTTPPVIPNVTLISYRESTNISTFFYEARDDLSGVRLVELGVGLTVSDIAILPWTPIFLNVTATITHKINVADGMRAFIRIRATNNVDLSSTSFSPRPIIVDRSPPIPGEVYDGDAPGTIDWTYQASGSELCAKWRNFIDPQSGISAYRWGAGTSRGLANIVPFTDDLPPDQNSICRSGLQLRHNTTYYSTIIAFNSATDQPRNSSASSNGVLVDLTDPIGGSVKDGPDISTNLYYTHVTTTVQAVWVNFSDPESHIAQYNATVSTAKALAYLPAASNVNLTQSCPAAYNRSFVPSKIPFKPPSDASYNVVQETISVGLDQNIDLRYFEFSHGDFVKTTVTAINGATRTTDVSSHGFLIDLTPPRAVQLFDGANPHLDESYQTSTNILSASWIMADPESGLKEYRLSIVATIQGSTSHFYPEDAPDITIQPKIIGESNILTCWSLEDIQLRSGTLYTVRLTPVNRADLSTVYTSSGIIPDSSVPIMDFIQIDTYGDESEETNQDGAVEIGDSGGIPVQWSASDPDSGISGFSAAVGTYEGGDDVSNYTLYPADVNQILPIQLERFEVTGKYYYVTVRAVNGAGLESDPETSTKIQVLMANVAGVVTVGHSGVGISGEYQAEADTITLKFEGFSSELCGIKYYEWAIGTTFAEDQIQELTTAGVVDGADGAGVAQALIPLELGESIFTVVKAVTACSQDDQQSTINSFGATIKVDWTAPFIDLTGLGQRADGSMFDNPEQDERIYQYNPSFLIAAWNATDPQSGIDYFQYNVGTRPFDDDVTSPTITFRNSLDTNSVDPEHAGRPNILHIVTFNRAGVYTFLAAPGITIDNLTPNIQQLQFDCTQYALITTTSLTCNWYGAFDIYSEVVNYEIMVGNSQVDATYYSELLDRSSLKVTINNLTSPLIPGCLVYTLSVINSVRLANYAFLPLIVDDTPPSSGSVSILMDQTESSILPTGELNSTLSYMNSSAGTQCKTIITNIRVRWEAFIDEQTPMDYYEIGIGRNRGQINILNYLNVGLVNEFYIEGLDLTSYSVVYVIVRGFNRVGLIQVANSDPIYIVLHQPTPAYVYDGDRSQDLQAQSGTTFLEAFWNFYSYCPGVNYIWAIYYMNQTLIQDDTTVTIAEGFTNNLALQHNSRPYVTATVFNPLGYVRSARSDGLIVEIDPLVPGIVYDGPFPGVDFNHQASLSTVMANWNSFGGANPIRLSETVILYEVALGTEPNGDNRFNIVPLESVYLNTSVTLSRFILDLNTIYYVTVKATSATLSTAIVTSNGIEPIEFEGIIEAGTVSIPFFQSVTTFLSITWRDFSSLLPIIYYQYAIGTNASLASFSCETFENAADPLSGYFDAKPYTISESSSSVAVSGLELQSATVYYAYVRVIDDSFRCMSSVSNPVKIDTTPPVIGTFNVGFNVSSLRTDYSRTQISYIDTNNTISITWEGFYDPESAISNYQILLVERDDCNLTNCDGLTDLVPINNVTNHTFYVLDVLPDKFYFVALRAINRAGLTSCSVSQPIKLDQGIPNQATLKHGSDWQRTPIYQGSTVSMQGVLALVREENEAVCMDRVYNVSSPTEDWSAVTQSVTPTIPVGANNPTGRTLGYLPKQAQFNTGGDFVQISMTRDIQDYRMLSAAIMTEVSIGSYELMSVRIKAASSFQAVTSVIAWEGPDSSIQDYEVLNPADNSTQTNFTEEHFPDSTCQYLPPPNPNPSPYKAFGFQLHLPYNSTTSAMALLWYRGELSDEVAEIWIPLAFDPSADYHTYYIELEREDSRTPSTIPDPTWSVLLRVDSEFLGRLVDLPQFTSSLNFALHVRNYNGRVEPFTSPFFPPSTTAYFTDIALPVDNSRVCKYGSPFYSAISPFIKFEVGVGLSYGSTNVSLASGEEFQAVPLPCIPCSPDCSEDPNTCDSSCNSTVSYITFEATGLSLLSGCTVPFNQSNVTCTPYSFAETGIPEDELYQYNLTFIPYSYYMTVRGYTSVGHMAYGYSSGIQLDTTPPNCTLIQHVQKDVRSDEVSNTTVQYSATSLAVQYECGDTRSDIYGYEIAYSDNVDNISSLQFSSVGLDVSVNLTGLDLNSELKYYVVVRATNGAGLTTILKSGGVRIRSNEPDVSRAVIHSMNATELATLMPNSSISSSLTSLGLEWTGFYEAEFEQDPIVRNQTLFWRVGNDFDTDDILPTFEVSFLSSFSIRIEDISVIGNTSLYISNITDLAELANNTEYNYVSGDLIMHVEPGRILYQTLILCAIQPKCQSAGTQSVTFYRANNDKYAVYEAPNLAFLLSIRKGSVEYPSGSADPFIPAQLYPTNIYVLFSDDLKDRTGFVYGDLSLADMTQTYSVIAAPTDTPYIPYIVNPSETLDQVERFLFTRVENIIGPAFFVSPIGGSNFPTYLLVQIEFNQNRIPEGMEPILVAWNPDKQKWVPTRSSCNFERQDTITANSLVSYFCPCIENAKRCNKPWQLILILASSEFVDTPPVPDPIPCISIDQGSGTIQHHLIHTDAQNDSVNYTITYTAFTEYTVNYLVDGPSDFDAVVNDSVLYFTPCSGCSGNATIQYEISETGTPELVGSPLRADNELTIEILGVNNNPVLLLFDDTTQTTLYREQNDSAAIFRLLVFGYDVDEFDLVSFSYLNCTNCELILHEIRPSESFFIPDDYRESSISSLIVYRANPGFFGDDRVGVVAEDLLGGYSLAYIFPILVRFDPCLNNATCKGPVADPDCSKLLRPEEFTDEYSCECTPEWTLRRCDTVNQCYRQPCPYNTTCNVTEVGGFECICLPEWPCSRPRRSLSGGEIAAIVLSLLILIAIIAAIVLVIALFIRKRNHRRVYVVIQETRTVARYTVEGEVFEIDEQVDILQVRQKQNVYYKHEQSETLF